MIIPIFQMCLKDSLKSKDLIFSCEVPISEGQRNVLFALPKPIFNGKQSNLIESYNNTQLLLPINRNGNSGFARCVLRHDSIYIYFTRQIWIKLTSIFNLLQDKSIGSNTENQFINNSYFYKGDYNGLFPDWVNEFAIFVPDNFEVFDLLYLKYGITYVGLTPVFGELDLIDNKFIKKGLDNSVLNKF